MPFSSISSPSSNVESNQIALKYGAEAASRRYFAKSARDLTEDEAEQLAAALPRPSQWHPGVTSQAYRRYVDSIKRRMAKAAFLAKML